MSSVDRKKMIIQDLVNHAMSEKVVLVTKTEYYPDVREAFEHSMIDMTDTLTVLSYDDFEKLNADQMASHDFVFVQDEMFNHD